MGISWGEKEIDFIVTGERKRGKGGRGSEELKLLLLPRLQFPPRGEKTCNLGSNSLSSLIYG